MKINAQENSNASHNMLHDYEVRELCSLLKNMMFQHNQCTTAYVKNIIRSLIDNVIDDICDEYVNSYHMISSLKKERDELIMNPFIVEQHRKTRTKKILDECGFQDMDDPSYGYGCDFCSEEAIRNVCKDEDPKNSKNDNVEDASSPEEDEKSVEASVEETQENEDSSKNTKSSKKTSTRKRRTKKSEKKEEK